MSVPKEKVGFQLLKQQAAKAVGLTFPREDSKRFWETLGYRGVEQVGGNSKKATGFRHSPPSGKEKRAGYRGKWVKGGLGS